METISILVHSLKVTLSSGFVKRYSVDRSHDVTLFPCLFYFLLVEADAFSSGKFSGRYCLGSKNSIENREYSQAPSAQMVHAQAFSAAKLILLYRHSISYHSYAKQCFNTVVHQYNIV